jgi:hypothetical protein
VIDLFDAARLLRVIHGQHRPAVVITPNVNTDRGQT